MINIETLKNLKNNDGLTLKKGEPIQYKSGWQVATEGIETRDSAKAMKAIEAFNYNCGIWLSEGVLYIDKSKRVNTKTEALRIGRECHQISIFGWKQQTLAYC